MAADEAAVLIHVVDLVNAAFGSVLRPAQKGIALMHHGVFAPDRHRVSRRVAAVVRGGCPRYAVALFVGYRKAVLVIVRLAVLVLIRRPDGIQGNIMAGHIKPASGPVPLAQLILRGNNGKLGFAPSYKDRILAFRALYRILCGQNRHRIARHVKGSIPGRRSRPFVQIIEDSVAGIADGILDLSGAGIITHAGEGQGSLAGIHIIGIAEDVIDNLTLLFGVNGVSAII